MSDPPRCENRLEDCGPGVHHTDVGGWLCARCYAFLLSEPYREAPADSQPVEVPLYPLGRVAS